MAISTISAILSSVKSATDIAKLLKESDLSLEKAEIKLKLANLIGALADVKMQLADVRELLIEKDEEIRKLQDELKIKDEMVYEKPYYWLATEKEKDGPYCQPCYDKGAKLIRLQGDGPGYWYCPVCKGSFTDKNYVQTNSIERDYNPLS